MRVMNAKRLRMVPALLAAFLLTSCGSDQQSSQSSQSYKDTKSIVLDILKTEEGQKAIQEASKKNQDKTVQLLSTGEGQQIQLAVKDILTKEEGGVKLLQQTMTDPKFAGDFAKAAQSNMKQLHKDLLKDPEYQKSLIELMDSSDYQALVLQTMKSPKFRQQTMDIIKESMQSPLFKAELIQLYQKAIQEEMQPGKMEQKSTGEKQGGGDSDKGDSSGESDKSQGKDNKDEDEQKKDKEKKK